MKTVYLVIGVRGTGSGSLTFPEDFDILECHTDEESAQEKCDVLNEGNDVTEDDDGDTDELIYRVHSLPLV